MFFYYGKNDLMRYVESFCFGFCCLLFFIHLCPTTILFYFISLFICNILQYVSDNSQIVCTIVYQVKLDKRGNRIMLHLASKFKVKYSFKNSHNFVCWMHKKIYIVKLCNNYCGKQLQI